jgi:hypothetical protein
MIDRNFIGREYPPLISEVEKGKLRFFAKATGATNPIYFDESAAKAAGHRTLPAPPTFGFSLSLDKPDPFDWLIELGVDMASVLHAEQRINYNGSLIYAGDVITLTERITDIYEKRDGALEFIVRESTLCNQLDEMVGTMISTIVIRN